MLDGGSGGTDGLSVGIEDGGINAVIRNRENGYLRMFTNNTERMRIDVAVWDWAPGATTRLNLDIGSDQTWELDKSRAVTLITKSG